MRTSQPRRMLLALVLAVALAVPSVAAARPLPGGAAARPAIAHAGLSWLTHAWTWLRDLWQGASGPGGLIRPDAGPGGDPDG